MNSKNIKNHKKKIIEINTIIKIFINSFKKLFNRDYLFRFKFFDIYVYIINLIISIIYVFNINFISLIVLK